MRLTVRGLIKVGAFLIKQPECVFIHLPKTAGASIRNGVFGECYEGPLFEEIPKAWRRYFSFTFVRNPYDRLVSAWKMFSSGMMNSNWHFNRGHELTGIAFTDFLKIATDDSIEYQSRSTIQSILRHHTLPMVHPFHCIQYARYVGRFESLEEHFAEISKQIGIPAVQMPHMNKSSRGSYRDYYDDQTFEMVSSHYREDIKRFDYRF